MIKKLRDWYWYKRRSYKVLISSKKYLRSRINSALEFLCVPLPRISRLELQSGTRVWIRTKGQDRFVIDELFGNKEYDSGFVNLPARATVVDLGSHIGTFGLRLKELCPGAQLLCVEPVEENIELLRKNLDTNDGVEIVQGAVTHTDDASITIFVRPGYSSGFSLVRKSGESFSVPAMTFDSVLKRFETIDLLKIDIEGEEYPIFSQDHDLSNVRKIIMEYHPWGNLEQLENKLKSAGFNVVYPCGKDENRQSGILLATR